MRNVREYRGPDVQRQAQGIISLAEAVWYLGEVEKAKIKAIDRLAAAAEQANEITAEHNRWVRREGREMTTEKEA